MTTTPKRRGGARPGSGRKRLDPREITVQYSIRLPASIAKALAGCRDEIRSIIMDWARRRRTSTRKDG